MNKPIDERELKDPDDEDPRMPYLQAYDNNYNEIQWNTSEVVQDRTPNEMINRRSATQVENWEQTTKEWRVDDKIPHDEKKVNDNFIEWAQYNNETNTEMKPSRGEVQDYPGVICDFSHDGKAIIQMKRQGPSDGPQVGTNTDCRRMTKVKW